MSQYYGSKAAEDRDMVEKAAAVAGIEGEWRTAYQAYGDQVVSGVYTGDPVFWNPLEDDAQALRLAVQLWLVVNPGGSGYPTGAEVTTLAGGTIHEPLGDNPMAAVRRAIVKAAMVCEVSEDE